MFNLSDKFINHRDSQADALESIVRAMDVRLIGHGVMEGVDVKKIGDFMLPAFLIVYYLRSSVIITHSEQSLVLSPGSFYIFKPFERYDGVRQGKEPLDFAYLYFDIMPISLRIRLMRNAFVSCDELFKKEWYGIVGASLEEFCRQNDLLGTGIKTLLQQVVKVVVTQMLCGQLEHADRTDLAVFCKETELIDQTFAYVEKHLAEPINIGSIAKVLGISHSSLDRAFASAAGFSPIHAVTMFKMEKSLEMLTNGCSVKQTAEALGYSSSFHFSSVFLSVMGKRPSIFINRTAFSRIRRNPR